MIILGKWENPAGKQRATQDHHQVGAAAGAGEGRAGGVREEDAGAADGREDQVAAAGGGARGGAQGGEGEGRGGVRQGREEARTDPGKFSLLLFVLLVI